MCVIVTTNNSPARFFSFVFNTFRSLKSVCDKNLICDEDPEWWAKHVHMRQLDHDNWFSVSFLLSVLASSMAANFTSRDAAASVQIYLQTFQPRALHAIIHTELTRYKEWFPHTLLLASKWSFVTNKAAARDVFVKATICHFDCAYRVGETFSERCQCWGGCCKMAS